MHLSQTAKKERTEYGELQSK